MNNNYSRKILFANVPGDGHFNPLTGLAVHLKSQGYDVRWYSSSYYANKISKLGIQHYPFQHAIELNTENFTEIFPERQRIKNKIRKLNFDMEHLFIKRGEEYYFDLLDIHKKFPFDLLVADCFFFGNPFVAEKMKIPVLAVGVVPLIENSSDLAPVGLALHPAGTIAGKLLHAGLRWAADKILFRRSIRILHELLDRHRVPHNGENIFDLVIKKSTLLLQSGSPGFEYDRTDLSENIRYIGPLLPYEGKQKAKPWFDERLNKYERVILVTQGTVEKDSGKLLIPTLEAFKNSNYLVVVTTGGAGTAELRGRFNHPNIIIEDRIPFSDVMPYADVYITNGGYGGVLLAIENQLPMVVAGIHEGKNEINARIGYFKLGIDLRTEKPNPDQLKKAVQQVFADGSYRRNVQQLSREFRQYNPLTLAEGYVNELMIMASRKPFVVADFPVY